VLGQPLTGTAAGPGTLGGRKCSAARYLCRAPLAYICRNNRSVLADVRANLNRSRGLRGDGLAGGSEKQEQEGNNQTHVPM
jgi:hypothetical protein